jgi:hypothetical protein
MGGRRHFAMQQTYVSSQAPSSPAPMAWHHHQIKVECSGVETSLECNGSLLSDACTARMHVSVQGQYVTNCVCRL